MSPVVFALVLFVVARKGRRNGADSWYLDIVPSIRSGVRLTLPHAIYKLGRFQMPS
jgi:hypothetical protein